MDWRSRGLLGAVLVAGACGGSDRRENPSTGYLTAASNSDGSGGGGTGPSTSGATGSASADTGLPKLDVGAGSAGTGSDPDSPQPCDQDVDIVFVMDVSTSMGPFLSKLAQEIIVVDQHLQDLDLPHEPHYGLVVFVDDFALLGSGAPYPDVASLQSDFEMWSTFTSTNQQVAGGAQNSTWPENSLDALYAGATGFQWRPAASTLRMIIHTTDDTFWNGPTTTGDGISIQHSFAETVSALQQGQIRDFSFTSMLGDACDCEDVTPGWSSPFMGMTALPEATDGGNFDLDAVLAGQVSLSAGIDGAVEDKMCMPYPPVG